MLAANREQIRLQIIDLHEQGVGIHEISRQINVTRNTVRRWVRRYGNEENLIDLRRNNHRPQVITQEQSRLMQRQYMMDAFTPTKHFAEAFEVHPSTVRRHLHTMGLHHRRPAKKIALTDAHKAARLIFARQYLNFDWTTTAFIDEKTFQSSQTGRLHLWRIDKTRYTADHVIANNASGRITANMSGWISSGGVGELVNLPPRATAQDYVDLLDGSVLPTLQLYYPQEDVAPINFVQDNATIHTARIVRNWFNNNRANLNVIPWPAKCADLNPVENLWGLMVQKWSNRNERTREALIDHCHTVWESFRGTDICQKLIGSMRNRLQAVIDNNGGYTRF